MFAVQVLMQAVVVAGAVLQDQGRGPPLPRVVAALQERGVIVGVLHGKAHLPVPAVGDRRQARVQRRAQRLQQGRQRVGKVLIFAAPKAMSRHHDAAAVAVRGAIGISQLGTLGRSQQGGQNRMAVRVQGLRDGGPVQVGQSRVGRGGHGGQGAETQGQQCRSSKTGFKTTSLRPTPCR
ncbi:hypothetical protein D3C72_1602990 [compost metagenome]